MPLPASAVVLIQTHNREVDYIDAGITYYKTFGLFKDEAGTDPVTEEGDEIAVTKDFAGTIQTLQPVLAKRGVMFYADAQPGVPCWDGDGGDDWGPLTAGPLGGQVTHSALFRSKTAVANSFWSLLDETAFTGDAARWGLFGVGGTSFWEGRLPQGVNRNGVELSSPFDLSPFMEWQVATVTTADALSALRGMVQLSQSNYGDCQIIALIMHDPADTAGVQAYLQTLKPGNVTPAPAPSGNALLGMGFF